MNNIIYEHTGNQRLDAALRRMQNRSQGTENLVAYNITQQQALELRVAQLESQVAALLATSQGSGGG
jgi:division protein CdvB (Snf7/Vps24/ESCRT-III family)